ncbi:glycosyltransferase family 4 protein [Cyclobacterium qasimii]|uniref:Glycosyltransferase n=2 Tax=Cyclobacterium qasimii TaxID=1350429 RepID=S7V6D5_9BACT|nr:glycosyltransferase family 4 protein [Cyclobacterium qasimii]EPR65760.1 glycosyltransferase [Cyclobacterium qasimii M12-11B]GEO20743.1 glycosyltransferase family 1 (GT1) [Cyclobacterium qasimii]
MIKLTKILYIHHYGGFSGAAKSLSYIIKNIDNTKYSPLLLNIEEGPVNNFFSEIPVKMIKAPGIRAFHGSTVVEKSFKLFVRNWVFLLPSIFKAYRILKRENPDVIHLNSTCLFAFGIAGYLLKIKVICHVREPLRNGLWGFPLRIFCKKFISNYIAICKFDLDSLRLSNSSKYKSEIIYNFVEKLQIVERDILVSKLGIANTDIIFLYLARFSKSNGWEVLINMAKKAIKDNPNYHFVMVGAQNENNLRYNDIQNIHVFPFVKDVETFLCGADVFVCPFVLPHFARGVIEASAAGLPIIGSNIGGVNELVVHESTGFLYGNESEFIKYVNVLGTDKLLRNTMGENGVNFAKINFDMNKNLIKTFSFYSKVINS